MAQYSLSDSHDISEGIEDDYSDKDGEDYSLEDNEIKMDETQSYVKVLAGHTLRGFSAILWLPTFIASKFSEENEKEYNAQTIEVLTQKCENLQKQLRETEKEKCDFQTRLSKIVSNKLRDNNPNIADLSDKYRPTKLAEMFSELYDNEWSVAYSAMETEFNPFHIESFLMDMIMEAYLFTRDLMVKNWENMMSWYLDENFPWYEETKRALMDGRKQMAIRQSEEVGEKFVAEITELCREELRKVLKKKGMKAYLCQCVRLCLLMNAQDPPVVMTCPGWKPRQQKTEVNPEQTTEPLERNKEEFGQPDGASRNLDQFCRRELFDRNKFRDYTKRGKFTKYTVWPVLLLTEEGNVLAKGVAQGTNAEFEDDDCSAWTWWR